MADRIHQILVIDADPSVGAALAMAFGTGYQLRTADTAAAGLAVVLSRLPSLIVLAVTLPDSAGLDVFRQLRSRTRTAHVPIMFLADYGEATHQKDILQAGADDFITKPFDTDLFALRIRNAIRRSERDGIHHPRSGLPTGRLVQERVRTLADEIGWYKLDFNIDNFDAFVERYGFMTGEEVIGFTAALLGEVVQAVGTSDDFIGQRDDTSFMIISRLTHGPALNTLLAQRFNSEIQSFYSFAEREQGYIEVTEANGPSRKPLMAARIKFQEGEPED